MNRCLDEGTLQSFTDGELSGWQLDEATSHLSCCELCASAASQLVIENELVFAALAPELDGAVPTERLRVRIDDAVAAWRSGQNEKSFVQRWFSSLSEFAFRQPTLAYGSLAAVLLFAVLAGAVYFRTSDRIPGPGSHMAQTQPTGSAATTETSPSEDSATSPSEVAPEWTPVVPDKKRKSRRPAGLSSRPREAVAKVELLPGERSYLRTIAALDSTIKSSDRPMRPALRAEYERNLALVDRALAAARTAAKNNPNDPDAAEFVFAAYQSKVDLLNTVADARVYNR